MGTNVNISGTQTGFRSESDIQISPANPNQIIGAANTTLNQAQFWSADGGATWHQSLLPFALSDNNHTDPAVGWTSDGTAWTVVMGQVSAGWEIRAYNSPDGGQTWNYESTASGTQTNVDREAFWVDNGASSAYQDNMYIGWHNGSPY